MKAACWSVVITSILVLTTPKGLRAAEPPLTSYNAAVAQTSVSGISSGAFMAVQVGTALSSIIKGVGAIAGGPYGCAEGSLSQAESTCEGGAPPSVVPTLINHADGWSRSGAIDDVSNIAAQKIYLFSGYNDPTVMRPVVNSLHDFYVHYVGQAGGLFYQTAIGAGHSQVTIDYGVSCPDTAPDYINRCGYDQAGIVLQHIYGALAPRNGGVLTGQVHAFDQAEFTAPDKPFDDSLDESGYVYVPAACQANEPCRLHVALHGCLQSHSNIGDHYIMHAGYNEWADTNHIIVLYPQTRGTLLTMSGGTNPEACWDFWGYLDANPMVSPIYLLKTGKQIHAIQAMITRITGNAAVSPAPASAGPAAPDTILAVDQSDTAIDVVWSAVPGAVSYDVFRAAPADADLVPIGTVSGLSYADAGLQAATQYRYRVRASSANGTAPFSQIISAATLNKVPPCNDPGHCAVR